MLQGKALALEQFTLLDYMTKVIDLVAYKSRWLIMLV
jgi:hypothetical protein